MVQMMITNLIDYSDGDTQLEAFVAYQETDQQRPLVLVAHDWSGRREFALDAAKRIADMGYVGMALDMYGKGVFGSDGDSEGNAALMNPFASDRALLRQRVRAALVAGRNIPQVDASRVAAMGYCFGGMCVLELARSGADVLGVISIHGILAAGAQDNEAIKAKVLCLHGHDDPMVPPEQVLAFESEMSEDTF
jgi:dienelactone hydrolase